MTGLRIMVVDDSLTTAKKLRSILEALKHDVVQMARNGCEAVAAYEAVRPDVVTMDVTMPDMNGIEATKQILALDPHARIIMITSHSQDDIVCNAMEAGACGYILKPFDRNKLQMMLRKISKIL